MPHRVQAHVEARLSGLPKVVRDALDLACVVGEQFRFETLCQASGLPEAELEANLHTAVELGLLSERDLSPGSDFRFALPGLREVLYEALSPRLRRRQHRRVVVTLGQVYAEYGTRIAHVLAYHYDAIGDWPATLEHALLAARETLARHDNDAAHTALVHARRAVEGLAKAGTPPTPAQQAQLQYLEGAFHARVGRVDEASIELTRAAEAASAVGEASLKLDVLLALAECHLGQGRFADGVAAGMRAIGAAQALGDRSREFEARVRVARCAAPLGRIDDAEQTLAPVLASTDPADAATRAFALREVAWIHAKRGDYAAAEAAAVEAAAQARLASDALAEYRAVSVLGVVKSERGDYPAAIVHLRSALALARALSLRRREGIELGNLGEAHHLAGDAVTGLELARQSLAIFREIGDLASEGDCRVNLGRILAALGREDEAQDMLEAGRLACASSGRLEYEGIATFELGKIRATRGELVAARTLFERARAQLTSIASPLRWQPEFGLAQACVTLGLYDQALAHATEARRLLDAQLVSLPPGANGTTLRRAHASVSRLLDDDATRTQG
jgi:tetratricopeptide (TPR) repeat protein